MTYGWLVGILAALSGGITALMRQYKIGPWNTASSIEEPPVAPPVAPENASPSPSAPEKVYQAAKASLGRHLTLNPSIDPEVGCAESVSAILKQCGYPIPPQGIPNVRGLTNWMLLNHFKEVDIPQPGAIITAHSVNELVTTGAHTGICLKHGIASNTSANGLFQENYSYLGWLQYFGKQGSKTRYFLPT